MSEYVLACFRRFVLYIITEVCPFRPCLCARREVANQRDYYEKRYKRKAEVCEQRGTMCAPVEELQSNIGEGRRTERSLAEYESANDKLACTIRENEASLALLSASEAGCRKEILVLQERILELEEEVKEGQTSQIVPHIIEVNEATCIRAKRRRTVASQFKEIKDLLDRILHVAEATNCPSRRAINVAIVKSRRVKVAKVSSPLRAPSTFVGRKVKKWFYPENVQEGTQEMKEFEGVVTEAIGKNVLVRYEDGDAEEMTIKHLQLYMVPEEVHNDVAKLSRAGRLAKPSRYADETLWST